MNMKFVIIVKISIIIMIKKINNSKMMKNIEKYLDTIRDIAIEVYNNLGEGWSESVYSKAMEICFRENNIYYENNRILPITFKGYVVGESRPDFILWFSDNSKNRLAIVLTLTVDNSIRSEHQIKLKKYMQELEKQLKLNEKIYERGIIINFYRSQRVVTKKLEKYNDVYMLYV